MSKGGNTVPSITNAEHIGPQDTGDNIEAKRVAGYGYDTDASQWRRLSVDADGKLNTTATFSGSVNAVTEYTDGDAAVANPEGPTLTFKDGSTVRAVSDVNPLPVDATVNASITFGETSTDNSTTTPLASGATFTGTGEQNDYAHVGVMVKTDNSGTLYFDFSNDGTNWDSTYPVNGFMVTADISEFHTAVKLGRYFRVRLINDTGAQSYLRLATYFGQNFLPTSAPLSQSITSDSDAIITRSVLVGAKDDGTYTNVGVTDTGGLKVGQDAEIDTNNSTTTPLGISATYTGTATDVRGYGGITVNIFADEDGVAGGMDMQFSTDGTNWISTGDGGFDYIANTERTFQFSVQAQYFRVMFANSASAQSAFRIQTLLHKAPVPLTTIHRADASLAPDSSAVLTKSVLMAQVNGSGDFVPIQASASGILKTSGGGGGGSGGTEYTEDALSPSNPSAPAMSVRRRDTLSGETGADGDWVTANGTDKGEIYVKHADDINIADGGNSITVDATSLPLPTGAATAANQQTDALTDTELRASPVVVDLGANNDVTVSGALTSVGTITNVVHVDDNSGSLTVDGTVTANAGTGNFNVNLQDGSGTDITSTSGALDVNIASGSSSGTEYTDGDAVASPVGTAVLGFDGSNVQALATDSSGNLQVDVLNSSIPVTDNGGSLTVDGTIAATQSGTWNVTNISGTVSLPTGASTAANQSTANGLLTTIDADTSTIAGAVSGTEMQVDVVSGVQTDALTDTQLRATPVVVDLGANNDVTVTSSVLPTGAATAANQQTDALTDTELRATPVVVDLGVNNDVTVTNTVAVDGSGVTQPVSGTVTANLSTTDNTVLDNIDSNTDYGATTGGGTETGALRVTIANNSTGVLSVDDNGGSLTVDGTVTANLSATDNTVLDNIEVNTLHRGATSAVTSVSGSATSVQILAANTDRQEVIITNDSTADLYLKLGTTASASSYTVKLGQDESYIDTTYTGRIDGIFSSATGAARVTEITNA